MKFCEKNSITLDSSVPHCITKYPLAVLPSGKRNLVVTSGSPPPILKGMTGDNKVPGCRVADLNYRWSHPTVTNPCYINRNSGRSLLPKLTVIIPYNLLSALMIILPPSSLPSWSMLAVRLSYHLPTKWSMLSHTPAPLGVNTIWTPLNMSTKI